MGRKKQGKTPAKTAGAAEKKWRKNGRKLVCILLGNLIYAAAVAFFILPHELITGGTTDLALIALRFFRVPVTLFVTVFNTAMFFLGLWGLGWDFAATTLVSSFCYPVILEGMQRAAALVGPLTDNMMLATLFAGGMVGIGLGMIIREGASSGGIDIPPLVIHRKTGAPVAVLLAAFDLGILLLRMAFSDRERILYGILMIVIYNLVLDQMLVIGKRQVQLSIISDSYEEINRWITRDLDRGTTLVHVQGGYLRRETMSVLTVVSRRELFRVNEKVKEIDPNAFMMIGQVNEVRGRGFTMGRVYR